MGAEGMRDGMIVVEGLRKSYGATLAVNGMDLRVEPGEVVGLLGPNGAGKTTTMEILEGLRRPDGGTARVLGRDVQSGLEPVRDRIGVVLQSGSILERATVGELTRLYGLMYQRALPARELLERVGLADKGKSLAGSLSGGQKQRLAMVLALIGDPDLLFLDEPTANLDPQGRALLWDMVRERTLGTGRAALLTTHSMEEAQALCSRVAIMDKGRLLAMDSPSALVNQHCPGATVTFETDQDSPEELFQAIDGFSGIERAGDGRRVSLSGPRLEPMLAALMSRQQQTGFPIGNLSVERFTLADVFLKLTGRDLRDE
uniref:ABC transporter ATP-binding protein n=1 Tax=Indioceanicola profundi TaxID=2220096 RepID=UPI000E6AB5D8|nr:ABC transporter ATP-binding protein [Indioceanicola profundi]